MTPEQERRLIDAFDNLCGLLSDNELSEFIGEVSDLCTGIAAKEKEQMGRKKKESAPPNTPVIENVPMPPEAPAAAAVMSDVERNQLIADWKGANERLKTLIDLEREYRQKLVTQLFNGTKLEGTETVDIGWGYSLRVTKAMNYTATNENDATVKLLQCVHAIDPALAAALVPKWTPELGKKACREVIEKAGSMPELAALLAAAVTVKPGMPQLEMVSPKQDGQ